ncbi:hypothetical protein HUJ05_007546 [Dendroctonus ponderosae]|nr:hypothetical protein HUJ05_007546 [Dendroctonus ponderosae]
MNNKSLYKKHSFKHQENLTFCVVSKRFRKNYIHRFTATDSIFIFSPFNSIRKICIYLSTNQYFDYLVMATILLNCVFLAMTETIDEAESSLEQTKAMGKDKALQNQSPGSQQKLKKNGPPNTFLQYRSAHIVLLTSCKRMRKKMHALDWKI